MSTRRQRKERLRKAAAERSRKRDKTWVSPVKPDCPDCKGSGHVLDRYGVQCACPRCYHVPVIA